MCPDQTAPKLCDNMVVKHKICDCCILLKSELEDLKSELESCKAVIRILYEDSQIVRPLPRAVENIQTRDRVDKSQDKSGNQSEGWRNISNRRRIPQKAKWQP